MRNWIRRLLLLSLVLGRPMSYAHASANEATFDGSDLHRVADIADGTWLVRGGDDPQWARPDYDDSQWKAISTEDDLKDTFGPQQPSVVWYRLRIRTSPTDRNLALSQNNLASAFEVYSNGTLLMRAGRVQPYSAVAPFFTQSPVPRSQIASGTLLVAIRIALSKGDWLSPHPGLAPSNILLGYGLQLDDRRHYRVMVSSATQWATAALGLFVGLIALGLFLVERQRREYLWAFLFGFSTTLYLSIDLFRSYYPLPLLLFDVLTGVLGSLPTVAAVRFFWETLGRKAGWWIHIYQWTLLVLPPVLYIAFDHGWVHYRGLVLALVPLSLPMTLLLPIVAVRDGRRGNREAWLLLIPLLFAGFSSYLQYTGYLFSAFGIHSERLNSIIGTFNNMSIGSLDLSLDTATTVLALCAITLIIVLRTNRISRQLSRSVAEFEAARGVQSMLLSRESIATPGFAVESVYQPAQEVGGDFFLVSSGTDGSLLVVAGDVSGKGLPAALRVSLILGALQREPSRQPREVLAGLNNVLQAQSDGGFTTCACALLAPGGGLILANAGHLAPYRNGEELAVEGGLPLGIIAESDYQEAVYSLASGDTLVFLSDGVVEARNPAGELFGFERTRQISTLSAAGIASAAQAFGQDDDITVVRITSAPRDEPTCPAPIKFAVPVPDPWNVTIIAAHPVLLKLCS